MKGYANETIQEKCGKKLKLKSKELHNSKRQK